MSSSKPVFSTPEEQAKALAEFLARHARPYNPAIDNYDRPPFAADIKEGKNDPIYNAHPYHTKVPPRSIIPYILHYTQPGDLVLDLFCGSGMTGVAAQMCANPPTDILEQFPDLKDRVGPRACILNDLSPAACHIAYNYNTPVDVDALKREFERIKAAMKQEVDRLYGTEHYQPAVGLYDPKVAEVAARLKNPPDGKGFGPLLDGQERTWELLTKAEVEARLGYPVTELPRGGDWGDVEVSQVAQWVAIPATIQYTIWSDVYRCEGFVTIEEPTGRISTRGKNAGKPIVSKKRVARGCGKDIVLWQAARNPHTGEVAERFPCPHCGLQWKKVQIRRGDPVPVRSAVEHIALSRKNGDVCCRSVIDFRPVTAIEQQLLDQVKHSAVAEWVPTTRFDKAGPQYRRNALSARKIDYVTDLFHKRSLRGLSIVWAGINRIKDFRLRRAGAFAFTGIVAKASRLNRLRPSGAGDPQSGTIYISSLTREENVWRLFENRFETQCEAFTRIGRTDVLVRRGSACSLVGFPDQSFDYIFTDPPFGSNIYYSEPNLIWEAWLGEVTDATDEAVVHRKNDGGTKRLPDYARLMQSAFAEMFRVLKPGRWATVEFNNSDGAVFEAIKQGIRQAGFEIVNMLLLDKQQKTFKQVKGAEGVEDVVDKDILFNLHKPATARTQVQTGSHDLEQQVAAAVRQHLQSLPERIKAEPAKYSDDHRSTATINSMLMNTLIPRGVNVDRLNLPFIERVCGRFFRKVGQRWYLRGEAVGNHTGPATLMEDEVTITDEVSAIEWLRQKIKVRPALVGELKPLWMRATGLLSAELSQSLVLEDLLVENFWRDGDSNRWREPTDEEREKMNDDRSIRVLHDAERFVAGTLRRPTTDAERCEWIDVLFQACRAIEDDEQHAVAALRGFERMAGYRLMTRLFQTVLREKVPKDQCARAEKQTRVASQRLTQEMEAQEEMAQRQQAKAQGPTLFDPVGDER